MMIFKIQYGQIYSSSGSNDPLDGYNLKSNMDRFIDSLRKTNRKAFPYLKSNMDRFIVKHNIVETFVKII